MEASEQEDTTTIKMKDNVLVVSLDGYDKNLNIAFEYDEPKHYKDKENNILRDYDVHRMNRIKEILGCTFWRYNEYLNLLYKY